QRDADDDAEFYVVDLIDLEQVAAPPLRGGRIAALRAAEFRLRRNYRPTPLSGARIAPQFGLQ
ncbi:hypothetical protein RCO28_34190, partial [Streptomyces sp. LHD-70]|uniref:hypothetical protein n=1 Tax=Streptomyces sp. LHD-70 TaxID=3072140 RepID=UPI00280E7B4A